ncbi:MAG: hypothetical protein KAY32_02100 [Candidatus Eisenbacteria sp.]|nr:hypothetical protein [Candidatus Eisenbacteria bacterium]
MLSRNDVPSGALRAKMHPFRRSHLCGLLLIGLIFLLGPLSGCPRAEVWTTYTDASYVSGIAAQGTDLWAGTSGGVLQWDLLSETYVKYTASEGLADQNVKDVLIDQGGDLWFGTMEGVQCFDGSTWTTYTTANSPLPHNTVYALTQDLDGAMWFGTAFGCAKFDGVDWEVFTDLGGGATNVAVRGIDVDSQNQIWTANNPDDWGDPGGVSMYDGSTWTRYDPDPGSIGQYFLCLAVDGDDRVWAGSWTNWVFMYDGGTWTHYDSGNSGLLGKQIESFGIEAGTIVWIGNHAAYPTPTTGGVTRFDGSTWTSYTPGNSGLPDTFVYSIAVTGSVIFCGTGNAGSASYDGFTWRSYETSNEPHTNWITCIEDGSLGTDDAKLYFGTNHYGIAILDGTDWSSYTTENSDLGDNYVNDVHISDGILWVCAQFTGLWEFDGATWENYNSGNSGLLGDIILSADTDSQGNLWLGTAGWDGPYGQNGAVAKYDGSSWTNYYLDNSGLIDDDALQVAVDLGDTVWVGTEEGISKFDGVSGWTSYHTGNSGLIENHVQAIAFDAQNGKWFATLGGVSNLNGETWTSYTTADGLPSNRVQDIGVSDLGVIWVATEGGAASFEVGRGWTAYTQGGGLGDNDLTAVGFGPDNIVWFGSYRSGITAFDESGAGIAAPENVLQPGITRLVATPNPFRSSVAIEYALPQQGELRVAIYDLAGRLVRTLADGSCTSQGSSVQWDGRTEDNTPAPGGIYLCRVECGGSVAMGKLILLR